jgi:four helix bundle protein
VCKKGAKECIYWLNLLEIHGTSMLEKERSNLIQEATELMKILAAIIRKSE